ncbi:MAG: restriction endonuclease subunit S, partial [Thermodesulfobacteriota bacterium]
RFSLFYYAVLDKLHFLFYWFIAKREDIIKFSQGGGQPNISQAIIRSLRFQLPTIDEQRHIIEYVKKETSQLEELIKKYQQYIDLLKEKRIALISHVVTKGLDPDVKMKDSGSELIETIPFHWDFKKLKYCVDNKKGAIKTGPFGSQLKASDMELGDVKVYNQETVLLKDITHGENYVSYEKYSELKAFEVEPGDILITTRGSIGQTFIVAENAEKGILHPCLLRIQVNKERILKEYLTLIIEQAKLIWEQLLIMSCATTIEVIYQDNMKNVLLPLPPVDEQEKILEYLKTETSRIDNLMEKINKQIDLLNEYKTSLISHAVTGKIDVRGVV